MTKKMRAEKTISCWPATLRRKSGAGGFSVIEIIIAMAIAVLTISAVVFVIGGDRSTISDSQINTEAISKAQQLLESEQAIARSNFGSIVAGTQTFTDGMYTKKITVSTTASPDTFDITSLVSWILGGRSLSISLPSIITNPLSGAICSAQLTSSQESLWHNPQTASWEMIKDLVPKAVFPPSNNFIIQGITPNKNHLFAVGGAFQGSNKYSYLFVFSVGSDPTVAPTYLTNVNITPIFQPSSLDSLPQGIVSDGNYVYIPSGRDYCTSLADCGQMIVVDVSKVDTQQLTSTDVTYYPVPGVTGSGSSGVGKSIYLNNKLIYLGLTKTISGPEFNIIDVGNGISGGTPTSPQLVGSYALGTTTRAIYVSGGFAYLATNDKTNGDALTVLDVSTPTMPTLKWTNGIASPSFGYPSTFAISNNPIYVGYTYDSSKQELFALNNPDPTNQSPAVTGPGLSLSIPNVGVDSMIVKSDLAFLITGSDTNNPGDFEIWNVGSPAGSSYTSWASPLSLPGVGAGGGSGTAAGCKGQFIYVGSRPTAADKGQLTVFFPGKQSQTITVTTHAPASAQYNSTFTVAATADSGLPVAITAGGVCTGSGSGSASITMTSGSGNCSVFYNQAGNFAYSAATQVTETSAATKATQTITVTTHAPASANFGSTFSVAATASSGLGVAITTTGGCSGSGTGSATITMTSMTVSCVVNYNQVGNANYNAASQVTDITAVAFDYTISASPANLTFTRTTPGTETITITKTSGSALSVSVTLTNLPTNVAANVNPQSCTPSAGSCTINFILSISTSAHRTGTVTATGASPTHATTFNVTANN